LLDVRGAQLQVSEVYVILKRIALAMALLTCAGLSSIHGVDAAPHSLQATIVAQASLPPLFDTESTA
jgi:hypothetical protein